MDPEEVPPLELAWTADGETLRRTIRMAVRSDKLAALLAQATQKLAAFGAPVGDTFLELCRDPDRWDEMDQQFHALRKATLQLEKSGHTSTLAMHVQLYLENVAKHLWNERTKSARFNLGSGSWATSGLRDVLEKMPTAEAEEIGRWFVRSFAD